MRSGFTLIELLVVLTIITLVMGVVVPKGAKLLSSYEKSIQKAQDKQTLSKLRAEAFLEAEDKNVTIDGKKYQATKKGVLFEISNDNG